MVRVYINFTFVAKVIYHDNLRQVSPGRPLDDAVDGSHQGGPAFIMKHYDHTRREQPLVIIPVPTPGTREKWRLGERKLNNRINISPRPTFVDIAATSAPLSIWLQVQILDVYVFLAYFTPC